ncbi:MAG: hypothetical protein VX430_03620 [Pseudomonadota bacterium]|nr:hypothetical protein [Pseudomonadota bacterium]
MPKQQNADDGVIITKNGLPYLCAHQILRGLGYRAEFFKVGEDIAAKGFKEIALS